MIQYDFCEREKPLSHDECVQIISLLGQLSPSGHLVTDEHLGRVVEESHLLVARDSERGNQIVGVACLIPQYQPLRFVARIEDVIVDADARGKGIGRGLMDRLIEKASALGCVHIDLNSRPEHVEANQLYLRLGFERRETNVYRLRITAQH